MILDDSWTSLKVNVFIQGNLYYGPYREKLLDSSPC